MHAKDAVAPLEPQDSSERDSLLLQATPKPSSARAFSFFSFMTHFFAFATFLTVVVLILEHYNFNDDGSYPFGTFGLHPLLMVTAFGLCSPVAMVSYKTYEYLLGVSHGAVKGVHAALQTIAVLIGAVGMASMWKTHEDARHFQTAHSWAGLAGFIVFVLNWLLGMAVFLNPCCPGRIRGALLQPHIVLGTAATVLTLLAVASGPLALVGKPVGTAPGYKNASVGSAPLGTDVRVWQMGNTAALFGCGVLVFLVLTMSEAGRIRLGHKK